MEHNEALGLMEAALDGELDPAKMAEVETHLEGCAPCTARYGKERAFRAALRQSLTRHTASDLLKRRVETAAAPKPVRRAPAWLALAASFALGVVLAGGSATWLQRSGGEDRLAEEIVADHVRSLMPGHLTDVISSDQHTVKPWFNGKVDFSPVVVDLAAEDFPLVGGRLDYLDGRPAAALVYRHRQHLINLFVLPAGTLAEQSAASASHQGYMLLHWRDGGMDYWAVSDVNPSDLAEFERLWRAADRS